MRSIRNKTEKNKIKQDASIFTTFFSFSLLAIKAMSFVSVLLPAEFLGLLEPETQGRCLVKVYLPRACVVHGLNKAKPHNSESEVALIHSPL